MLTDKQIYDLNNMNVAAQNVALGTTLNNLVSSRGGGAFEFVEYDGMSMSDTELGTACWEVLQSGKKPCIDWEGDYYYPQFKYGEDGENDLKLCFVDFNSFTPNQTVLTLYAINLDSHDGGTTWELTEMNYSWALTEL